MLPAWHEPFTPEALRHLLPTPLFAHITPEIAWGGSTGRGVRVAVVDSGIEADHPAVGGMVRGFVAVEKDGEEVVYDESPHDDSLGHGTACAGIIHSLAPDAELYSVKVLGTSAGSSGAAFAAGLRWVVDHNMHLVNLSLGTTKREFYAMLHELADHANFHSVTLVTAANNFPEPSYPSMYASVISVACHDAQQPLLFYYNPAPPVDFGATGVEIQLAWQAGEYITATGNSFAAPHITGIIALILGKHPGLAPYEIKTILRNTAQNVRVTLP